MGEKGKSMKGIRRRVFAWVLTFAMVLTLMPSMSMTVKALAASVKLNKVSINWDGDLNSGPIKTLIILDEYVDENPNIKPDYISIKQEFRNNGLVTEYFDESTGALKDGKSASDFTIHRGAQEIHPNDIWLKMVCDGLEWRISYLSVQFPTEIAGGTYLTYTPCTVTYHYLNKESDPKTEVKWLNPKDVTTSIIPESSDIPEGKSLEGWYETSAYAGGDFDGDKYTFGNTIKKNIELYARWVEPGTFSDLNQLISDATSGSTITLDKDYVYNAETDSSNKNIMIPDDKSITMI